MDCWRNPDGCGCYLGGLGVNVITYQNGNGSWRVSAVVGGFLVTRVYYGFTRSESVARFRAEMKGGH